MATAAAGVDNEDGGADNDTFNQEAAANGGDALTGGEGIDTADYSARIAALTITSGDNTANDGQADTDMIMPGPQSEGDNVGAVAGGDIETLFGGSAGDNITGSDNADTINGGPGNDTENGGAGDGTFDQGDATNGADILIGGTETDTVDCALRVNTVAITLGDNTANDGEADEDPATNGNQQDNAADWVMLVNLGTQPVDARIRIPTPLVGSPLDVTRTVPATVPLAEQFPGTMGGPLRVSFSGPLEASIRSLWSSGASENFEEVSGTAAFEVANTHYWPWYDGVGTQGRDWIHVVNPSEAATANVTIQVGADEVATLEIPPGENRFYNNPDLIGGPVTVDSDTPVLASQRVLWEGVNFSETQGLPLVGDAWFTWYDYPGSEGRDWIVIGNPGGSAVTANVTIGGQSLGPFDVAPNTSIFPTFEGVTGGPVHVVATGGQVVVSQRAIWGGISMEEVGGTSPVENGTFSWYDALGTNDREWVLVANVGASPASFKIAIEGNQVYCAGTSGFCGVTPNRAALDAGEIVTPQFPNVRNGPVEVTGSSGSDLIMSRRSLWGARADFTEMLPF